MVNTNTADFEKLTLFSEKIHKQFIDYYHDFQQVAERATHLFTSGELTKRLQDDLLRVQLYRIAINKSVNFAKQTLSDSLYDLNSWEQLRLHFIKEYNDKLATTYFTSVMRKVFAERENAIEFDDDGIQVDRVPWDEIIHHYPLEKTAELAANLQKALQETAFAEAYSPTLVQDSLIIVDIIKDQLPSLQNISSFDILKFPFFRGKGAYLIGRLQTETDSYPMVLSCMHTIEGVKIDAVLVGYEATRSFLFSSTRSAFTVSTLHYREMCSFFQQLFPGENPAYILDIIGFTHPAKILLLQQLRSLFTSGEPFRYLGAGPVDFVFGVKGFPLVFKVIRRDVPDKQAIIDNFIKVHMIDRLGQILDSLDYRNLKFERNQFSKPLITRLEKELSDDVIITSSHVFFKRVYAARRIIPVSDHVHRISKSEARHILLSVGWNVKHLAAMGFLPRSLSLEHFGLTSWGRIVYLDNASLIDLRLFTFRKNDPKSSTREEFTVDPSDFEKDLVIPPAHREIFRAIHGDLFTIPFWLNIKRKVLSGSYPDFFPYPSRYRLKTRRFHLSVYGELQRMGESVDARHIYMGLNNLAVVDTELAGLHFLRLEVPQPSARVLVIEPIGPEIIAQLHHRFRDVTFDILQSESEVVESAGHWTPGIHGKLNALVQIRKYDYAIGYVNETFDREFFRLAKLKGFLLLSTGTHNIDIEAATSFQTVVTNAPGPTTTTVAEQNIGLALDGIYSEHIGYEQESEGFLSARMHDNQQIEPLLQAHILWFCFLQKILKLDTMFTFGASDQYVRTGIGEHATVYHDQIGQNSEAGIIRTLGIIGLHKPGQLIVDFAIAHDISKIYVLKNEYELLSSVIKRGFDEHISIKKEINQTEKLSIEITPVDYDELTKNANYIITTDFDQNKKAPRNTHRKTLHIDLASISINDFKSLHNKSPLTLTIGIQGLGRIGEAVAQRALSLGMDILIYQRNPERSKYTKKLDSLRKLAAYNSKAKNRVLSVAYAEDKHSFFTMSNIITTLAATTAETQGWVNMEGLAQFATKVPSPVQVIVSAGKGLVDEDSLLQFLRNNISAQARLDVLVSEHEGGAYLKLVDEQGQPLPNIKVTGHTAAAVREVRQLKIYKALDNLRDLIDGKIPPNIINHINAAGKPPSKQAAIDLEGLQFFRINSAEPKANVVVIEPLPPEIVLLLQQRFKDVSFDILQAESELVEKNGLWTPGINNKLNAIVAKQQYDYCLGYCNATFDASFFKQARLQGLILFSTATHHIDLKAADEAGTIVTNSPGYTTVAVTEQNIGMVLDALYGKFVRDYYSDGAIALSQIDTTRDKRARTVAQIMWYVLLKRALRLDAMFEFGTGDKYVRTGVRNDATVYHDQLGQYQKAHINTRIGIIGLDETGINLIELAMAFEISVIYILESEYSKLPAKIKTRLADLQEVLPRVSQTDSLAIEIIPVDEDELLNESLYTLKTPTAYANENLRGLHPKSPITVLSEHIYITGFNTVDLSLIGQTFGVQGFGRIGEAVVQRALAMGADVLVCQRKPDRPRYQEKLKRLMGLAKNRAQIYNQGTGIKYVKKEQLFKQSNIVTTLAATTSQTRYWVDTEALENLGTEAKGNITILVNAGKGLLNEAELLPFLKNHPKVEVRLDVLSDEQEGNAGKRFLDSKGKPLENLKITGHTAAAVPELRLLKILNAFNNLRLHIDGKKPNNIVAKKLEEC